MLLMFSNGTSIVSVAFMGWVQVATTLYTEQWLMNTTVFMNSAIHQLYLAPPLQLVSWVKYYNQN